MFTLTRLATWLTWAAMMATTLPAAADYAGASGYGKDDYPAYELDVSHSGYPDGKPGVRAGEAASRAVAGYVVIEVEDGRAQEIDGDTVIVVQEPEPVAVSAQPPPPLSEAPVKSTARRCRDGIWVNGYWSYENGQYVWINGHCVVEQVNYVFVHPRWDYYANVWWFVPGYYRPCSVWVGYGYYRPRYWFPPYYRPYYRGYRGIPVHRGAVHRPTVAHPVGRSPVRGTVPAVRSGRIVRAPSRNYGRTTRLDHFGRAPATRMRTVSRPAPTRTTPVARTPATRTRAVGRTEPTRSAAVTRAPATRTRTVVRPPRANPGRAPTVTRTPSRSARTAPASRPSSYRSRGAGHARPSGRPAPARQVARPSFGGSRTGSYRGRSPSARPSMGRPSMSRPSSRGMGGSRSVPTVRGR